MSLHRGELARSKGVLSLLYPEELALANDVVPEMHGWHGEGRFEDPAERFDLVQCE